MAPVQEHQLSVDQTKAVRELLSCCSVARTANFTQAPRVLMKQALAEVLEELVGSDLKTSQIWGSPGAPRPAPLALVRVRTRPTQTRIEF